MLMKIADRVMFYLYFKNRYKKMFRFYGENIRWGKHFERMIIPRSVRISCPEKISIGDNCQIDEGVYLQCHYKGAGIFIGSGTRINAHTHVLSYSHIHLGEKVLIAPFSLISSGNHGNSLNVAVMDQEHVPSGDIIIEDGCWIGQHGKVMGGVKLASNITVAAGAIVTKSCSRANATLLGIPARELSEGKSDK